MQNWHIKSILREFCYMEKTHGQQQKKRIVKFKLWKWNFWEEFWEKTRKDKIRNTMIRDVLKVEEIKNDIKEID